MKHHAHFTELSQEQLDWISRFADRLRLDVARFAQEDRGEAANRIAVDLWEKPPWRALAPEAAAERWLAEHSSSGR
jgi:hypothetical protein